MFSHIMLGTNDLVASRRFYDAVMPSLGYACHDSGASYAGYGLKEDIGSGQNCLWLGVPRDGNAASTGNGTNIAFLAKTRVQVDAFYSAALAAGAIDEGAPGLRSEVHPHFYAAYIRDPDGHKLAVVCHKVED
jgi:catechol 2,3-dioxygenase-like lactoylglutathione lyase family enzyme